MNRAESKAFIGIKRNDLETGGIERRLPSPKATNETLKSLSFLSPIQTLIFLNGSRLPIGRSRLPIGRSRLLLGVLGYGLGVPVYLLMLDA